MNIWQTLGRSRMESVLTLAVVLWLAWLGRDLGSESWTLGADGRYSRDLELRVEFPAGARQGGWMAEACARLAGELHAMDPEFCKRHRSPGAGAALRERLGLGTAALPQKLPEAQAAQTIGNLRAGLASAHEALLAALYAPLADLQKARKDWESRAGEGFDVEEGAAKLVAAKEATRQYREAYQLLTREGRAFPLPLECAWQYLATRGPADASADSLPAFAALLALMDGKANELPGRAFPAKRPFDAAQAQAGCAGPPLEAAQDAARLVALAYASAGHADKARALQAVLPGARAQLAVWAFTGLAALWVGRLAGRRERAWCFALAAWALAAALTHPRLEWLGGSSFPWLRGGWQLPALLGGLALLALRQPARRAPVPAYPSTALGYPGFVLFAGLGWWIVLDLSAFGHFDNRFQGLYQQSSLFIAFMALSLAPLWRQLLARGSLALLSFWPWLAAGPRRRMPLRGLALLAALAVALLMVKLGLKDRRQQTSELFRAVLILGGAWFLLARGELLASPWIAGLASRAARWGYRLRLGMPLALLLGLVVGGLLVTDDKGPLLVIVYTGSILAGVGVVRALAPRTGFAAAAALGMLGTGLYLWACSWAMLKLGDAGYLGERIEARVESTLTPFLADNDQMARVLWFQDAALEAGGFGLGGVPWCGDLPGPCRGVPPQIQSDYLFTAWIGVFGVASWLLLGLFGLWLWRLARSLPLVTTGRVEERDLAQAWFAWAGLCWAGLTLTQTAVTVAGNLCWLPLTGITFPMASYGTWSLLANAAFLGIALHLNARKPA